MMQVVDWHTLLGVLGGGISAYVAIKSDLKALHVKCDNAGKAANTAHRRIDQHLQAAHSEKAATAKA